MKVTTIEEVNNITTMRLDKLFGSLRTFELSLDDNLVKKKNSVAFHEIINEETTNASSKSSQDENLAETVTLLSKRFSKFKSKFYLSGGLNSQPNKDFTNNNNLVAVKLI